MRYALLTVLMMSCATHIQAQETNPAVDFFNEQLPIEEPKKPTRPPTQIAPNAPGETITPLSGFPDSRADNRRKQRERLKRHRARTGTF